MAGSVDRQGKNEKLKMKNGESRKSGHKSGELLSLFPFLILNFSLVFKNASCLDIKANMFAT
jgi:hypothetical protein